MISVYLEPHIILKINNTLQDPLRAILIKSDTCFIISKIIICPINFFARQRGIIFCKWFIAISVSIKQ